MGKEIDLYELIEIVNKRELINEFDKEDTMKLFLCLECTDIVRCFPNDKRTCKCGKCSGTYLDNGVDAVFTGGDLCVPIGFANSKLVKAVDMARIENKHQEEPTTCKGVDFNAFVILDCSSTIKRD